MSSALEKLRRELPWRHHRTGPRGVRVREAVGLRDRAARRYVVRPASVQDVQAAVRFAAGTGLALSVRGGGHGFQGFAHQRRRRRDRPRRPR